jgi:hypothetical protein
MKGIDIDKAKTEIKGERLEFEDDRDRLEEDFHVKIIKKLKFLKENC